MSEDDNSTSEVIETAKAVHKTAETIGKGLDGSRELGNFFGRFLVGPLEEASGLLEDRLRFIRFKNRLLFRDQVKSLMEERGLEAPTRDIPLNIGVPILEEASMAEDNDLRRMWAGLFVNAADADSGVDAQRSLVSILRDFGPMERRLIQEIHTRSLELAPSFGTEIRTIGMVKAHKFDFEKDENGLPTEAVQVALLNLRRLACILYPESGAALDAPTAAITALGRKLLRACI